METPQQPANASGSRTRIVALQAIGLITATLVVYLPSVTNGFVWDDKLHLLDNIVLKRNGLFRVWFTADYINYWPLTWSSYWIEYQLWGFHPTGYHVTNVLLHTVASLLLWRVLDRLRIPAAWFAALVFAVHPVNVESVAWIAQRKNVLCLVFYLAALLAYLKFDENGQQRSYVTALFCFLLAMLSKGAAAALPVVLLMCVLWRRNGLRPRDLIRTIPFFVVAAGMSLVEIWFQYFRSIADEIVRDDSFVARVAGAGWCVWFYFYKALVPLNLSFVYPRWTIEPTNPLSHVPNLAILALFFCAWKRRRTWGRSVLFAGSYFVITLAPVLGFFNIFFMKYSLVADHYQYLSIIAPIALLTAGGWTLLSSFDRGWCRLVYVGSALLIVLLGSTSWRQTRAYENHVTLWQDTIQKNPDCWLAHYNLANIYSERRQWKVAAEHYQQTLRINAEDAWAHHNLGLVLEHQGRLDEAAESYERSFQIDPTLSDAQYNLGNLRLRQSRPDEAIAHFQAALRVNPRLTNAETNLATILERQGKIESAMAHYRRALVLNPANVQAHLNLGQLLLKEGDRPSGEAHLREAARLNRQ